MYVMCTYSCNLWRLTCLMWYVLSRAAGIKYICDFDDPFGGPKKKERTADTFKNIFEKNSREIKAPTSKNIPM